VLHPIQTCASRIWDSIPALRSYTHVDRPCLGLLPVLKNNVILGSHCTFVCIFKAVGCTRWMESAWCCSFSWTPSRLGADSTAVKFKGERSVVRSDCNPWESRWLYRVELELRWITVCGRSFWCLWIITMTWNLFELP
jgi:hypothetical protein